MKHTRGGAVAEAAAEAADSPFNPHQGQTDQKQRYEIGNHKRAAAVTCGLDWKPEKIAEADCASGDRQNHPQPA